MKSRVKSLGEKIVAINMVFFSAVLLLLFILFYTYWLNTSRERIKEDLGRLASVKGSQLFDRLWSLDRLAVQLANDFYLTNDIFPALLQSPLDRNMLQQDRILNKEVISRVLPYSLNKKVVSRICLFNDRNDFIYIGRSVDYDKTAGYALSDDFREVVLELREGTYRVILPPRPDPFFYESIQSVQAPQMLSLVRKISGYSSREFIPLGFVEVQLDLGEIAAMFSDLDEATKVSVSDASGQIIFDTRGDVQSHGFTTSLVIDNFDFTLTLYQSPTYTVRISLILGGMLVFVLTLLAVGILTTEKFVIRRLTGPLDELHRMVNSVDIGNLDFDYRMEGEIDQIRHLNLAFQEVLRRLRNSIDEKIEARTDELKAQLYALQAQMNPHFIHNTIAVISSLAEERDVTEIEDICTKLSRMIRYTSRYNLTRVDLEDEVGHLTNYLELMKIRYEKRMIYGISGNYAGQHISVPKFFLQPLVENSFNHGFKAVQSPWTLEIGVTVEKTRWYVTIIDNGPGFTEDIMSDIEDLRRQVSRENAGEIIKNLQIGGMGLKNVFARFFLRYREAMIFELRNGSDAHSGAVLRVGGSL